MRKTLLLIFHFVLCVELAADDFKVEDVIHPVVIKLGKPSAIAALGEGHMAISSNSEIAASHVAQ